MCSFLKKDCNCWLNCQFSFIVSTNLTLSDRGWPGYLHPESEAWGARGGRCSLLPVGQVRALECTVQLRRRGPECWELAGERVDRWLCSAGRQSFQCLWIHIQKGHFRSRKKHSQKLFVHFILYRPTCHCFRRKETSKYEQIGSYGVVSYAVLVLQGGFLFDVPQLFSCTGAPSAHWYVCPWASPPCCVC